MTERTASDQHDDADRDLTPAEIAAIVDTELRRQLAALLQPTEPA